MFEAQYSKFSNELDTLGARITSVSKQYETVSGVRERELLKSIENIKSGESILEAASSKTLSVVSSPDSTSDF